MSSKKRIVFDLETSGLNQGEISPIFMGTKGKPTNFMMKTMIAAKEAGFNVVHIDLEKSEEITKNGQKLLCQLVKEMKSNGINLEDNTDGTLGNTK